MNCFVTDMREKEVINLKDGCRLGPVCDVEFDTCSGNIVALIIFGKSKLLGLMGRCDDIKICWNDIKVIGDDIILVDIDIPRQEKSNSADNSLSSLFRHR